MVGHAGHTGGTISVLRIYSGSFDASDDDLVEQACFTSFFALEAVLEESV